MKARRLISSMVAYVNVIREIFKVRAALCERVLSSLTLLTMSKAASYCPVAWKGVSRSAQGASTMEAALARDTLLEQATYATGSSDLTYLAVETARVTRDMLKIGGVSEVRSAAVTERLERADLASGYSLPHFKAGCEVVQQCLLARETDLDAREAALIQLRRDWNESRDDMVARRKIEAEEVEVQQIKEQCTVAEDRLAVEETKAKGLAEILKNAFDLERERQLLAARVSARDALELRLIKTREDELSGLPDTPTLGARGEVCRRRRESLRSRYVEAHRSIKILQSRATSDRAVVAAAAGDVAADESDALPVLTRLLRVLLERHYVLEMRRRYYASSSIQNSVEEYHLEGGRLLPLSKLVVSHGLPVAAYPCAMRLLNMPSLDWARDVLEIYRASLGGDKKALGAFAVAVASQGSREWSRLTLDYVELHDLGGVRAFIEKLTSKAGVLDWTAVCMHLSEAFLPKLRERLDSILLALSKRDFDQITYKLSKELCSARPPRDIEVLGKHSAAKATP